MAYVSKERKNIIQQKLEEVLPKSKGWRWTLSGAGSSTLRLKISQGPLDLIESVIQRRLQKDGDPGTLPENRYYTPNVYHLADQFSGEGSVLMDSVRNAMNTGNHDNSDSMTDYFDVGWYLDIRIGEYDDPFLHVVVPDKWAKKHLAQYQKKELGPKVPQYMVKKFLPYNFNELSAGKKAAATKKAKEIAAKELGYY